MSEQWRDIAGYEGWYQVSNFGQIRSVDRIVPHRIVGHLKLKGQILHPSPLGRYGHVVVNLCKKGHQRTRLVHRLVAAAWIGPCPKGQQVRHGPNGVADNSVSNLCYGTSSEDSLDKRRDGTHGGRPVRRSDGVEFINICVAAEETGCWAQDIGRVCRGQRQTSGGWGWAYI